MKASSPRSVRVGLWLESIAYAIAAAGCILAAFRTEAVGYFLLAGTALILGGLVIWKAQDPTVEVGGSTSSVKRLTYGALAFLAIVFLLAGAYLNVAV